MLWRDTLLAAGALASAARGSRKDEAKGGERRDREREPGERDDTCARAEHTAGAARCGWLTDLGLRL